MNKEIKKSLTELMEDKKQNRTWNSTIEITPEIVAAHDTFMEYPIDYFMNGDPISRKSAGWSTDILAFAAGVQYARSLP